MQRNLTGERIKLARLRQNLKQIDIAIMLEDYGVSLNQTTVGKIERGVRYVQDYELLAFAEVLGVSVNWLLTGGKSQIDN